jgi:bZIP factor
MAKLCYVHLLRALWYAIPQHYFYDVAEVQMLGNRIERCLSYDEKPLLLFQKLKDAKKNPVFMLKHIKDIRSPIAVAQQKHAARKASSVISQETTAATLGHHKVGSTSRIGHRPPKLEVQDSSTSAPTGWENNGLHPNNDDTVVPNSATTQVSQLSVSNYGGSTLAVPSPNLSLNQDSVRSRSDGNGFDAYNGGVTAREMPPASNGKSYAVAIYPYMAEQDDEFDVVV